MTLTFNFIFLLAGLLLFVGVLVNKPSTRYGIPGLILYLSIGLFIGNGGEYDFVFNYPEHASIYSNVAISLIIFIGGLQTDFKRIRPILKEGIALSTIGVLLTTAVIGLACYYLFGLPLLEGILIGTVLSATDAAAVFSILETKKLKLREHISEVLELESGTNDPMAYFLTISLTSLLLGEQVSLPAFLIDFLWGIFIAVIAGFGIGRFTIWVINHIRLDNPGLYQIMILAAVLFMVGLLPLIHGNLLLAMYISGVTVGNHPFTNKESALEFFKSISWIMEISLFILLGLQVFPSELLPHIGSALIVTAVLILLARPLSVFFIYLFMKASWQKKVFI
ncbi:MAG: cation:proton antiporter, partial [Lewinella sp.]|nr:cation:proton antiporter [Lewinella sp.]